MHPSGPNFGPRGFGMPGGMPPMIPGMPPIPMMGMPPGIMPPSPGIYFSFI